jgi:hypothetical protein
MLTSPTNNGASIDKMLIFPLETSLFFLLRHNHFQGDQQSSFTPRDYRDGFIFFRN